MCVSTVAFFFPGCSVNLADIEKDWAATNKVNTKKKKGKVKTKETAKTRNDGDVKG